MSAILKLLLCGALVCCAGCATRHKHYSAPDPTRVNASAKRLEDAVTNATSAAARAQLHVEAAQRSAEKAAAESATVTNLTTQLEVMVPAYLRPAVANLKTAVNAQLEAEGDLSTHLAGAIMEQGQLRDHLAEANAAKVEALKARTDYQNEAGKLALWATEERNRRIAVEKKLSWYRWHWRGSWIALGAGLLVFFVFTALKFSGRIAFTGAKIAAKI